MNFLPWELVFFICDLRGEGRGRMHGVIVAFLGV